MPQVYLCIVCRKEVDEEKEKWVLVNVEQGTSPRRIAHAECAQKAPKPATPAARRVAQSSHLRGR